MSAPILTDVQKLQIQNAALVVENWHLKAQYAATASEHAGAALLKAIVDATPEGYTLTDTLDLVAIPEQEKPVTS